MKNPPRNIRILVSFVVLVLASPLGAAVTRYVSTTGNNGNQGTNEAPFRNLWYAATQCSSGDLIHVKAGTYEESVVTNLPVGVSIEGEGETTTTIRPASSFSSASPMEMLVKLYSPPPIVNNAPCVIRNIGFDGRGHAVKYAIWAKMRSNITIREVSIKECRQAAIRIQGDYTAYPSGYEGSAESWTNPPPDSTYVSNILVEDCDLANNARTGPSESDPTKSWSDGAISFVGLINSTIRNCVIDESVYGGWGIWGRLFKESTISGCSIKVRATGLLREKDFGIEVWNARNSQFFDIETNGGLSIALNDHVGIHHNRIVMTGEGATECVEFGGSNSWCSNNYAEGALAIAIWANNRGLPQTGLRVQNNVLRECQGAVFVAGDNSATFDDLRIENNTADNCVELWNEGAFSIRIQDATSTVTNTKLRNNLATNTEGYGMSFTGENGWLNYASQISGTVVDKNMFWGNTKGGTVPVQRVSGLGSLVETNTLVADPLYAATGATYPSPYYTLQSSSPAKGVGVNVGLPCIGTTPSLGAWVQPEGRVEAEMNYSVAKDVGGGTVGVATWSLASNTRGISINDPTDTARVHFTVPISGNYQIGLRVRSGWNGNSTRYFNGGYTFKVDGLDVGFAGDTASVSAQDPNGGIVYWGTMNSQMLYLSAGLHSVEITGVLTNGAVDYLELSPAGRSEAESNYTVVQDTGTGGAVREGTWTLASKTHGIWLSDPGDTAGVQFNVATSGNYSIGVRVRSGWSGNSTRYFNNGYTFKVDGVSVTFAGAAESVSSKDASGGGVYWGTMIGPSIPLVAGTHTVEVGAVVANGAVDFLELTPQP